MINYVIFEMIKSENLWDKLNPLDKLAAAGLFEMIFQLPEIAQYTFHTAVGGRNQGSLIEFYTIGTNYELMHYQPGAGSSLLPFYAMQMRMNEKTISQHSGCY